MKVGFNLYKDGKHKALTMSYDDGQVHDIRLLEIFNKYGIKGTFHLNSGKLDDEAGKFLTSEQVATVFDTHEVSVHSLTHPYLERVSDEEVVYEIVEDRKNLEKLCGYPVRGMSYPFGTYDTQLIEKLRVLGMQYSRTIKPAGVWSSPDDFKIPDDFMQWHPTCHHADEKLFDYLAAFKRNKRPLALFYVWGHSFEFPRGDGWTRIEEFCEKAGGDPDVWYATNIEIYDYIMALRALRFSADRTMVYNPTATDVWVDVDGKAVVCPAGKVTRFTI
ncbi:MAG: polysaccharide deacetylase family protein [Clostridia bacterium]|nr:polysaccharide deacetylase family protein [Clostridia bacterium]